MFIKNFPNHRFGIRSIVSGDYFKEMENISLDDIKSLTPHEFNSIPLFWLYDWAEAHGLLEDTDIVSWLKEVRIKRDSPRPLNCSNKIAFKGIKGNERIFEAKGHREISLLDGLVSEKYKEHKYEPASRLLKAMNKEFRKFICDYEKAKLCEDGFMVCSQFSKCLSIEINKIYLRHLRQDTYQFIVVYSERYILNYVCSIESFLQQCDFFYKVKGSSGFGLNEQLVEWVKSGDFPLLNMQDIYLQYQIKYLCKCGTQEEADYLANIDGIDRYIPNKQEYGSQDIKVLSQRVFYRRYCKGIPKGQELTIYIDGKKQKAVWYATNKTICICSPHCVSYSVGITQELYDRLYDIMQNTNNASLQQINTQDKK